MGNFKYSGGVEIVGFISPTDPTDLYPVIDPLYGIDGFRNVDTLSDLNNIPNLRRRSGMVVGVSGGTAYYKLNPSPWVGDITDWSNFFNIDPFTGGSGNCVTELYVEDIFACNTGVTFHNDIKPFSSDTVNIGNTSFRFRDVNTLSGTSSYWTSTVTVNTPQLDLGLDSLGNSRQITANSSVIQNDTLNGGTF